MKPIHSPRQFGGHYRTFLLLQNNYCK